MGLPGSAAPVLEPSHLPCSQGAVGHGHLGRWQCKASLGQGWQSWSVGSGGNRKLRLGEPSGTLMASSRGQGTRMPLASRGMELGTGASALAKGLITGQEHMLCCAGFPDSTGDEQKEGSGPQPSSANQLQHGASQELEVTSPSQRPRRPHHSQFCPGWCISRSPRLYLGHLEGWVGDPRAI